MLEVIAGNKDTLNAQMLTRKHIYIFLMYFLYLTIYQSHLSYITSTSCFGTGNNHTDATLVLHFVGNIKLIMTL